MRAGDESVAPARSIQREGQAPAMAVIDDVRPLGSELERSYPVYVRGRLKFRVGQIVYVAFSTDERVMGFAFPKEERQALAVELEALGLAREQDREAQARGAEALA